MRTRSTEEKEKIKQYYINKKKIEIRNKYYNKKIHEDVMFRILNNISRRTYIYLKNNNIKLKSNYQKLLGCTTDEYKEYLSALFKENMNFNNYGEWEIDHIKPISLFNLNNKIELEKCFNYKNTQPLWKTDNRRKYNKYDKVVKFEEFD